MKRLLRKILVVITIIAPIFSGNSCSDDKCGCSGDLQQSKSITLKIDDIIFTGDSGHRTGYFVDTSDQHRVVVYYLCNPNEVYSQIQEIENPFIHIEADLYWNCQYAQRSQNYPYQYGYSMMRVEYDINVKNITPEING